MTIIRSIVHRIIQRRRTVYTTTSALSGEIMVVDRGRERRLIMNGETHSVYYKKGGWDGAAAEYWGLLASPPFETSSNPDILMLGLGGATAVRLMCAALDPASVTVAEADPAVVAVAREYFDLGSLPGVAVVTGDGIGLMRSLAREGKSFDLIVDDAYFDATSLLGGTGPALLRAMVDVVRPGGILIMNRPVDRPEHASLNIRFAEELRARWPEVEMRSVRGEWWNDVIFCHVVRP